MLPVEIMHSQGTVVLRARSSELLILPRHVRELKAKDQARDFSAYFTTEALINRAARKLFEGWLRKDRSLWPRLYRVIHKEIELKDVEAAEETLAKALESRNPAPAAAPEAKPEKKVKAEAKAKPETKAKAEAKAKPETKAKAEVKAKPEKKAEAKAEAKPAKKTAKKTATKKTAAKKTTTTKKTAAKKTTTKKAATKKTTKKKAAK